MLTDFIWKAFEKTGDARYYLEYKLCKDIRSEQQRIQRNDRMEKIG